MNSRIEIVGLLGSGKTTLLNNIEKRFGLDCVYEELSPLKEVWSNIKPIKPNYYLLQSSYYLESLDKLRKAKTDLLFISDFSMRVHHFVYSFYLLQLKKINKVEWDVLTKMFEVYSESLPRITGLILIDASPKELSENLHQRNRNLDANTSLEDLIKLAECFKANRSEIIGPIPNITFTISELKTFDDSILKRLNDFIKDHSKTTSN